MHVKSFPYSNSTSLVVEFSLPAGSHLTVLSATMPAELKIILMKLVLNFWVDNTRHGNIFKRQIPAVTAASLLALPTFRTAWGGGHLGGKI